VQHWEGTLGVEDGVLKILDGRYTKDRSGSSGSFSAEKIAGDPNVPSSPAGGPVNLGPNVNSNCHEGSPDISGDGLTLLFDALDRPGGQGGWDIWMSRAKTPHHDFGPAQPLPAPVNSPFDESGPCMSADGLTLYFASDRPGGSGDFDLYVSTRKTTDDPWGEPVNLGPTVNSRYYDNHPCISADGLTLYFDSRRPGVPGQSGLTDLYLTRRATLNDPWGTPEPLAFNTPGHEYSPNVSRDDLTLYYDSPYEGRDLWVTKRAAPQDPWQKGVRLGPPFNTSDIDTDPSLSADGSLLYFVSDRPGGFGGFDIWVVDTKTQQTPPPKNLQRFAATGPSWQTGDDAPREQGN
jgi:Tol biopolymer transport system component